MLTIIAGRTRRLWPKVLDTLKKAREGSMRSVVLVPEQYTLRAERDVIDGLHLQGLIDIEVLSQTKLMQKVFDTAGADTRTPLNEQGRLLNVARAISQTEEQLRYYRRVSSRPGFAPSILNWLGTLKDAGLAPEELNADLPQESRLKLSDLKTLYAAYERLMEKGFADTQDQRRDMLARLEKSGVFDSAQVIFFGFDLITPPIQDLALAAARLSRSALLTIVSERAQAPDGDMFEPVRKSVSRLLDTLHGAKAAHEFVWLDAPLPESAPEIAHIEQNLLNRVFVPYEGCKGAARLFSAETPYTEAAFAAEEIRKLTLSGMAATDIAVIVGDLGTYGTLMETLLNDLAVPCYLSAKRPLVADRLIRSLLAAFLLLKDNWRLPDMEDFLDGGFSPLDEREVWTIKSYAYTCGIKGTLWKRPFRRGKEPARLAAEPLRQRLIAPLIALQDDLRASKTARESLAAVLSFLSALGAKEKLAAEEMRLLQQGDFARAALLRQVWQSLIDLLNEWQLVMEDERIPIRRFAEWMTAALQGCELSSLPPTGGCCEIGALGQLLPSEPKAVFVLGLNDGMLDAGEDPILEQAEIESLSRSLHLNLGQTREEKEQMRQLDLWKALSAPSEKLYISYALSDEEGMVKRPHAYAAILQAILPGLKPEGGATYDAIPTVPLSPDQVMRDLGQVLNDPGRYPAYLPALSYLMADSQYGPDLKRMLSLRFGKQADEVLTPGCARRLYDVSALSPSRIEAYAACPYLHFSSYGLKLEPMRPWGVQSNDLGAFYHRAMQGFSDAVSRDPQWPNLSREAVEAVMLDVIRPLTQGFENLPFGDTERARAAERKMEETLLRTAWTHTQISCHSAFSLYQTEWKFGEAMGVPPLTVPLNNGDSLRIRGTIDRVDTYENDSLRYARIVDYKSSAHGVDPAQIYEGMQLQLLLYLKAAIQSLSGFSPAGYFYQQIADPLLRVEEDIGVQEAEDQGMKELKLTGIALNDPAVYGLLDTATPPFALRRAFKKDQTPFASAKLATEKQFDLLLNHALHCAAEKSEQMRRGKIDAVPLVDTAGRRPCDYCPYADLCRRDPLQRKERYLTKMKLDALYEKLENSQDTGGI